MAWLGGQSEDGVWGVRDTNPASDSNLWIAYSLFEAARLWAKPEYEALARQVLWNVRQQEVVTLGELGPMLIPARKGFTLNEQGLRFNPSYLPEFQLRYFAAVDSSGSWAQMLRFTQLKFKTGGTFKLCLCDAEQKAPTPNQVSP